MGIVDVLSNCWTPFIKFPIHSQVVCTAYAMHSSVSGVYGEATFHEALILWTCLDERVPRFDQFNGQALLRSRKALPMDFFQAGANV